MQLRILKLDGDLVPIAIEGAFWDSLSDIAQQNGTTSCVLVRAIWRDREGTIASAIRTYVLHHYQLLAGITPKRSVLKYGVAKKRRIFH